MSASSKREARKAQTAEDFTPPSLVNEMLDKLAKYGSGAWNPGKTFLDPACGNGNMLVEVLKRKLSLGHDPSQALSTIYGCDIMRDNIRECRLRLLKVLRDSGTAITLDHIKTVFNQVVLTSLDRYENGSLDYDFSFTNKASGKDLDRWLEGIEKEGWLDDPSRASKSMDQIDSSLDDAVPDDLMGV